MRWLELGVGGGRRSQKRPLRTLERTLRRGKIKQFPKKKKVGWRERKKHREIVRPYLRAGALLRNDGEADLIVVEPDPNHLAEQGKRRRQFWGEKK